MQQPSLPRSDVETYVAIKMPAGQTDPVCLPRWHVIEGSAREAIAYRELEHTVVALVIVILGKFCHAQDVASIQYHAVEFVGQAKGDAEVERLYLKPQIGYAAGNTLPSVGHLVLIDDIEARLDAGLKGPLYRYTLAMMGMFT